MKRLIVAIYIVASANIILALNIFNPPTDTLEIKTSNYSNSTVDSSVWINIDFPQIVNSENSPVLKKINQFLEEEFKQSIPWFEEMGSDTAQFEEFPYEMQYTFETNFQVVYNSKEFVSIVMNHYQFTGGAHGNYFALGYNIKIEDGTTLSLNDIIEEGSFDLLTYECEQSILETYQANSLTEAGLFENEIAIPDDQDFYIIPGALVLQFDPYEIGPYAMGDIIAEIPFEKINDILKVDLPFPTK